MAERGFYVCKKCGLMVHVVKEAGCVPTCCGEEMTLLVPGSTDAAVEKHVPDVMVDGDLVKVAVGSVEHPMTEEHYIEFVFVQGEKGGQMHCFAPGEKPEWTFSMQGDVAKEVYAYCNLHGLWVKEL